MTDIRIFNLQPVGKGVLKATVSVDLGIGIIIHECKIIERDGKLCASLPQRMERTKGASTEYIALIELQDPTLWEQIEAKILHHYRTSQE